MRTCLVLSVSWLWLGAVAFAAEPKPPAPSPKLATLLSATNKAGQPVLALDQRARFDGLNERCRDLLNKVVEEQVVTSPEHLATLLTLDLRPEKMELLWQDNCLLCHTDPESQSAGTLFSLTPESHQSPAHLNLRDFVDGVHFRRGLSCAGCHGGDPASTSPEHVFVKEWRRSGRQQERGWILNFCARCHSDPAFMNRFNPGLPTDQMAKYQDSPHGKLLLVTKDRRAPTCVSCHGIHDIRGAKSPLSKVYPKRVPETCGACHANPQTMAGFKRPDGSPMPTNQLALYRASVHGRALLERDDLGAPACNKCHGNHAAMPVGLSSVSQSCSLCHAANASLFDGSKHKLGFELHHWPQCAKCHGEHGIAQTQDSMLGTGPESLCVDCHRQYAKDNPECMATAAFFSDSIITMDSAAKSFTAVSEQLAMKGLDVEAIDSQLNDLADSLKQSRSAIHSFSRTIFQQAATPGQRAVQNLARLANSAKAEYRTRQLGLLASIVLMGLVMVTLYLKLRRLERPQSEAPEPG